MTNHETKPYKDLGVYEVGDRVKRGRHTYLVVAEIGDDSNRCRGCAFDPFGPMAGRDGKYQECFHANCDDGKHVYVLQTKQGVADFVSERMAPRHGD